MAISCLCRFGPVRRMAAAGLAIVLLAVSAAVADNGFTKGPYIQMPAPGAVTILYETANPGDGTVRYGTGGAMDRTIAATLSEKMDAAGGKGSNASGPVYLYRARIEGLAPGAAYQYQVVHSGSGGAATSGMHAFHAWPDRADRVTFIAYGDTRSQPDRHRAVAANFLRHNPAFILHSGDLISSGSNYAGWGPEFFGPLAEVIDHVPLFPARGNHDGDEKNLLRLFDLPGGHDQYSFTYGPVHVVVLDDNQEGPDVLQWLERDLVASTAPWKIVTYHAPTFNLAHHVSATGRDTFLPVLERCGVDMVVTGHSHLYERFVPLRRAGAAPTSVGDAARTALPRQPITFITTGGGGAPTHPVEPNPLLAKTSDAHHYCVFTVDRESLRMQAITADGKELDSLAITKKGGRYDDAYLAQVQPMEAAIIAQGLIKTGSPTIAAVPGDPDEATFSVHGRFPGLYEPVTLAARVADENAKGYEVRGQPATAEPGKDVTLTVRIRRLGVAAAEPPVMSAARKVAPNGKASPRNPQSAPALRIIVTATVGSVEHAERYDIDWPGTAP